MKVSYWLFAIVGAFGALMGTIYGSVTDWKEPVGPVGLFLAAGLGAMVSFYLWMTSRRLPPASDDDPFGEIADHEGNYGQFAPYSWWPLWLALTAAITVMGLAVGWWLFAVGAFLTIFTPVGWVFESYKGPHAL